MLDIDLILFDMDGTMFDTEQIWFRVCRDLLKDIGHPGPPELYYKAAGTGGETERKIFAELLGFSEDDAALFIDELYKRGRKTLLSDPIPVKPGLIELLTYINERSIRWSIVSSSPRYLIDRYLRINNIDPPSEPIVDVTMIQRSKPHPDPYLMGASLCDADPSRCLVIEDSHTGVASALAAGMSVIMVPDINEPTEEEKRDALAVVPDLSDIIPILSQIISRNLFLQK